MRPCTSAMWVRACAAATSPSLRVRSPTQSRGAPRMVCGWDAASPTVARVGHPRRLPVDGRVALAGLTNRIVGGGVGEQLELVRRFAEATGLTPNGRHS